MLNPQSGLKQELLLLTLIVVFALLIRLWDLGAVGFNNDEAIYSGQAATLAGNQEFREHFSIYRAHPLLLQYLISILFANFGVVDTVARTAPVVLGVLTVVVTYLIGKIFYERRVAMVAALVVAILPYHIIISRQVLLDVSLSFFYTVTFLFIALHIRRTNNVLWIYLAGASAGLSFLSKEVGIFALITVAISMILAKTFSVKNLIILTSSFLLASSPYWIPILTIQEAHDAALSYWLWQTSRDPNQPVSFYFNIISQEALGYVLVGLFILSIIYALKTRKIKEPRLFILLLWIGLPLVFFQFLAVKGYAFIAPLIPAFVLLGVSFLFSDWMAKFRYYKVIIAAIVPLIFLFSGPPLHYLLQIPDTHLVGSGGEPYIREAALWIRGHIPNNGTFLTLDTRTANVIKYYSNIDAVSLHGNKNPAYTFADNPDIEILNGRINYLVYDIYLARQLPYLQEEEKELKQLVTKYGGIPIHTENETYTDKVGKNTLRAAVIIYSLNTLQKE
jgi:4-amino-4-deoxy-L-arabinose transferase-like glycosyltransferase